MTKPLLVLIPCYKEAANLSHNLPKVCEYLEKHHIAADLLIVEGEKLDDTAEVVRQFQKQHSFLKLTSTHKGKGHQVRTGLQYGDYDQYLFMDADLATPLKYIDVFLSKAAKAADLGMVTGVRIRRQGNILRKTVSTVLNVLLKACLGFKQTDTQCGFKLLSKPLRDIVIEKQINNNWIFDIEYFVAAAKNNLTVIEVPIPEWQNDYERATLNTPVKFIQGSLASGWELGAIIWHTWRGHYKI